MRDVHARMLEAVLDGEGLDGVAELAALEAGGPVAIALPARSLAGASTGTDSLEELMGYMASRLEGDSSPPPTPIALEMPVRTGDETIGSVLLLGPQEANGSAALVDRGEVLWMAALASLAEVAVVGARDEVADEMRGSLIEDLRSGELGGADLIRRAARLGCDLERGGVALVAQIRSAQPRNAAALICSEYPGAISGLLAGRVYAILPAQRGEDAVARTLKAARTIAGRLRKHGPTALSSHYPNHDDLRQAIREAELVLEVIARDERLADQIEGIGLSNGVYRLLFRTLVIDPDEVWRFYEDTVAPLVAYDAQYQTELLATLESYLDNDCNMNATARAIFAHRHTIAYRLSRARELTGLDASVIEDRERLGLGIKAYRILAPLLPR